MTELRRMLDAAEQDGLLAAHCMLAARGLAPEEATPAQLVGALREVGQQRVATDGFAAMRWIAAQFGRK